jgi:excisionase family DNA binding protein
MTRRWATLKEAAEHIRASDFTIRAAIKNGDLPAYPIGKGTRDFRLDLNEVDEWMASRSYEPKSASA